MSVLKLILHQDRTRYSSGDEISGAAGWVLESDPKQAEVRLFWFTRGKGTTDTVIVATLSFPAPKREESRTFSFALPADGRAPYSFSGKLISVVWAVELVVNGKEASAVEITVGPGGQEVHLYQPGASVSG